MLQGKLKLFLYNNYCYCLTDLVHMHRKVFHFTAFAWCTTDQLLLGSWVSAEVSGGCDRRRLKIKTRAYSKSYRKSFCPFLLCKREKKICKCAAVWWKVSTFIIISICSTICREIFIKYVEIKMLWPLISQHIFIFMNNSSSYHAAYANNDKSRHLS